MQPICPACGSDDYFFLGRLGNREHFGCRSCGVPYSWEASAVEEGDLEPFPEDVDVEADESVA